MFTLLFLATVSGTPAQLGTYQTEKACNAAIQTIYETQLTPRGADLTPDVAIAIKAAIEIQMKYQREYRCVQQ
ncbi:MAG TPA: hypothetical protein VFM18_17370 [Methanosarcina sp.]|nr:hypothetical protein [Methanosarcina sp.]